MESVLGLLGLGPLDFPFLDRHSFLVLDHPDTLLVNLRFECVAFFLFLLLLLYLLVAFFLQLGFPGHHVVEVSVDVPAGLRLDLCMLLVLFHKLLILFFLMGLFTFS